MYCSDIYYLKWTCCTVYIQLTVYNVVQCTKTWFIREQIWRHAGRQCHIHPSSAQSREEAKGTCMVMKRRRLVMTEAASNASRTTKATSPPTTVAKAACCSSINNGGLASITPVKQFPVDPAASSLLAWVSTEDLPPEVSPGPWPLLFCLLVV